MNAITDYLYISPSVDFIEIHAAHGYLLHSFVSPLSNVRDDQYGGQPIENRLRFPLRVIKACRGAWEKPLWVRISAYDWAEGPERNELGTWKQWGIEQSKIFVGEMQNMGVDLVDVSSGGNWVNQEIPLRHGYQVCSLDVFTSMHSRLYGRSISQKLSNRPILLLSSARLVSLPTRWRPIHISSPGKQM